MVESLGVVIRSGSIFVGALIVGSLVRYYKTGEDDVWTPSTQLIDENLCPKFVCDTAAGPESPPSNRGFLESQVFCYRQDLLDPLRVNLKQCPPG